MPRYAIVVTDPEKHHAAEVDRNVKSNVSHHLAQRKGAGPQETAVLVARMHKAVLERTPEPRPVGTLHAVAETECPDGLPNCRNCGDPAHTAACRKAGHCPLCGIAHGVAPERYLADSGVELVEVEEVPSRDVEWNIEKRSFVKRQVKSDDLRA